ncbi:MAG: sensor histidine kinase, partial [Peptostreptococcaceae bacterium]
MKSKNRDVENSYNVPIILIISTCIFLVYSLGILLLLNEKSSRVYAISENDIIIISNLTLVIMGIISCLLSFNSNKKEEVYIISLMYTIFAVDIIMSKMTGYLNKSDIQYHAILTSFIRVLVVYIAVSNFRKLKQKILNNKLKSFIIIILISIVCIYTEYIVIQPYNEKVIIFYEFYNLILIIIYVLIGFKYFKKSIIYKDYIYGVIGSSALLFSVKSIYDYCYLIKPSIPIYILGYLTIISAFVVHIIGIFIELSESINKIRLLDDQRSLFIKIIEENQHMNIMICDENYNIEYKNRKFQQSVEEMNLNSIVECEVGDRLDLKKIFKSEVDINEIENSIKATNSYRKDIYLDFDDSILDFSIHLFEMSNKKFKIISIIDISAKYKLEKALLEHEVMRKEEIVKNEFFSNISHELKTPLNVIYSTNQLLDISSNKNDFNEIYKKYSESLNINCKRMLRLIDNIVDITKLDVGYKKPNFQNYNIVSVVEDMTLSVINYAKIKDIEIIFDTDVEEINIKLDLDMLERIILNLLSNAIKFSDNNSTII